MKTYPLCLIGLENQRSVVVGGGKVALRKVKGLAEAGATVTVISPEVIPELQAMAAANHIELLTRAYQTGDLRNAYLVIAATDNPAVNQAIWEEANQHRCLVNVVDDPHHSNFILPAVVRRGDFTIAISTGGSSPALAKKLKEQFDHSIEPEYADFVAILAELRPDLIHHYAAVDDRLQAALDLIDSDLFNILCRQGKDSARSYAHQRLLSRLEEVTNE